MAADSELLLVTMRNARALITGDTTRCLSHAESTAVLGAISDMRNARKRLLAVSKRCAK